jgi:hypothetical protein
MNIRGSADCRPAPPRARMAGVGPSDVNVCIGNTPKHVSAASPKTRSPGNPASSQKNTDGEAGNQVDSRPQRNSVLEDIEPANAKGQASSNTGHAKRKQLSPPIDTGSVSLVEELPEVGSPPLVIADTPSIRRAALSLPLSFNWDILPILLRIWVFRLP